MTLVRTFLEPLRTLENLAVFCIISFVYQPPRSLSNLCRKMGAVGSLSNNYLGEIFNKIQTSRKPIAVTYYFLKARFSIKALKSKARKSRLGLVVSVFE